MAPKTLWQNLKALVNLDNQREEAKNQLTQAEKIIDEDRKIIPQLQESIERQDKELTAAQKNVDLQELNAQELKQKEKDKKDALENVHNQKEFTAIQKELDKITQQIAEQDDALVKAWHHLDNTKAKSQKEKEELQQKIEQLKKDIAEKENSLTTLKTTIIELDRVREEKVKVIPLEWITRYERMRKSVPDPIVPVANGSCSACYYSISPQDFSRLKQGALLPCRSCYRFLYYDAEEEKETKEESY